MSHRSVYKLDRLKVDGDRQREVLEEAAERLGYLLDFTAADRFEFSTGKRIMASVKIGEDGALVAEGMDIHLVKPELLRLVRTAVGLQLIRELRMRGFLVTEKEVDRKIKITATR